ncbi:MAG: radical SAM-associated putative lipoprotein [Prevotellaceae bacterium]|jgi:putative lipoprotein (rSAM/lipoprotein system)|nr:radical SAM-associated putative lipoprotein [Prevotellaceae bacterium]
MKPRKIYIKCLFFLLTLLGFSACIPEAEIGLCAYGTPTASYKVKGTAVSAQTKSPLPNIRVAMREPGFYVDTIAYAGHLFDTAYTDSNGSFNVEAIDFPYEKVVFYLDFTDPSGSYSAKRDSAVFENPQFKNGDGWHEGEAEQDVGAVELDPAE